MTDYQLEIDYMDMTDDGHVLTRLSDARPGFVPREGSHVIVGSEEADPAVAHVLNIDEDDIVELAVLTGPLESHRELLTRT